MFKIFTVLVNYDAIGEEYQWLYDVILVNFYVMIKYFPVIFFFHNTKFVLSYQIMML